MDRSFGSGLRLVAGCCELSFEPSDFIKYGFYLEQLSDYHLLKKDSAPWSQFSE
jgi:hypothetical protein